MKHHKSPICMYFIPDKYHLVRWVITVWQRPTLVDQSNVIMMKIHDWNTIPLGTMVKTIKLYAQGSCHHNNGKTESAEYGAQWLIEFFLNKLMIAYLKWVHALVFCIWWRERSRIWADDFPYFVKKINVSLQTKIRSYSLNLWALTAIRILMAGEKPCKWSELVSFGNYKVS